MRVLFLRRLLMGFKSLVIICRSLVEVVELLKAELSVPLYLSSGVLDGFQIFRVLFTIIVVP